MLIGAVGSCVSSAVGHVFISYSRDDKERVEWIVDNIAAARFDYFVDTQMPSSVQWESYIKRKISDSACLLVVWSDRSVVSSEVKKEVFEALRIGKVVVPVRIDRMPPPNEFSSLNVIDLSEWRGNSNFTEWQKAIDMMTASGVSRRCKIRDVSRKFKVFVRNGVCVSKNQGYSEVDAGGQWKGGREFSVVVSCREDLFAEVAKLLNDGYSVVHSEDQFVIVEKVRRIRYSVLIPLLLLFFVPGLVYLKILKNTPWAECVRVVLVEN